MTESVKRNNSTSKLKGVLRKSLNFEDCELREVEKTFEISRDSVKKYKKKYSYFIYKPVTLIEFYKKDTVCEELMEISEPYITFIDLDFFLDEKKVINFFKEIKTNKIQKKFLVYGSKKNLIKLESYYKFFKENGLDSIILFLDHKENNDSLLIEKLERAKINVWAYFNLSPNMDKNDFVKMRNYIKKLAIKNRVKIIAEEMKTKDDTVGKIISIKLKIKHLIIEPTDDEKIKLNIKKVGYIQWCFMSKYEMEYLNIKDLDDSKLNEYKREVEKTKIVVNKGEVENIDVSFASGKMAKVAKHLAITKRQSKVATHTKLIWGSVIFSFYGVLARVLLITPHRPDGHEGSDAH